MKDHAEEKPNPVLQYQACGRSNVLSSEVEYFKVYMFQIGMDSPNVYEKIFDLLALYASMSFKNGSDVVMCL